MKSFSFRQFRQQFPILENLVNAKPLIYFDNAATTQKPICVINSHSQYYQTANANVHRSSHALSAKATSVFEQARTQVKNFIKAESEKEIIWTKGSTEGINLIAQSWGRSTLKAGDEILLSYSEHHANIVPWQIVAQQTGAKIKVLPLTTTGQIDLSVLEQVISERTKILCFAHISNVLGRINPVREIIKIAKKYHVKTLVDGAQAIAHLHVDVDKIDCDFYVFSAHKMYGPTGVGVLYGKQELLNKMPPYQAGGEMIKSVSFEQTTYNQLPHKFEAGTPNIAGIAAMGATIDFIEQQGREAIHKYERQLKQYCYQQLLSVQGLKFIVDGEPDIAVFSFTLEGQHNHDVASALDSVGIAVRSGHHCAMPLMKYLNISGCIRLSLSAYNSIEEIDFTVKQLKLLNLTTTHVTDIATVSSEYIIDNDVLNDNFISVSTIVALFSKAKSWDSKHREIMMLGKKLSRLHVEDKDENSLIAGCESHAWLVCSKNMDGIFRFNGDSEAKIIRGLITIVLAAVDNKTAEEISAFDMEDYFSELGLLQHLSPSRGNGLRAIVEKIHDAIKQ